jgi:hypothetical protein
MHINLIYLFRVACILDDRYTELHHVSGEDFMWLLYQWTPVVVDKRAVAAPIVLKI